MMSRLAPQPGEWLDRTRRGVFEFEGQRVEFLAGDTYSSALAASGRLTLARSFKYHRRRGLFSAANHDANVLLQIDGRPNQRGDVLLARAGARVAACNTSGGVERDRGAHIEKLARFLPVGFYYKTCLSRRWFPSFERVIRRVSGLGRIDPAARATQAPHRYLHCDVAVVGAGLSGMTAALAAQAAGAGRVVLVDESPRLGGAGTHGRAAEGEREARAAQLRERIATARIHVLEGHCAFGLYEDGRLGLAQAATPDGGLVLLRAARIVLATGAIEQPIVFRNNDLPGVLLASAAQRLLQRHAIACGSRIVVVTATPEGAEAALDLAAAGVQVVAVATLAGSQPLGGTQHAALTAAGLRVLDQHAPVQAIPDGAGVVAALELENGGRVTRLACDSVLLSAGWSPALQLSLQGGGTLRWSAALQQHLPDGLPSRVYVTGRAKGIHGLDAKLADAELTGAAAARGDAAPPVAEHREARSAAHAFPLFAHPKGKEFVDLDEDLTIADLRNAMQEGFDGPELLKRYSTVGMGPSQGKLSSLNALRLLAAERNLPLAEVAMTTARPPYQGVTLGALAGATPAPLRRSALDDVHAALGAQWLPAGAWRRPAYYARDSAPRERCIAAEVRAVRESAGLIDVSTLGKIHLLGPDAGRLLEASYTGRFLDQRVGTTRYALMTDEAGMIIDDGVVARSGPQSWYVTATTGASAAVHRELQRRVIELSLDCVLHNATGALAAVNLAGPRSRDILAALCRDDLGDQAFPYLGYRELELVCAAAQVMRVGFVGELAYEIHVPFDDAAALWTAIMAAGGRDGVRPFGVEAQRVLRLEKGHIIVGQDTDALTSPDEAGLARAVRLDKGGFTGARSIEALRRRGPRQQLIGFTLEAASPPFCECNLVLGPAGPAGRVTSVAWSPTLGRVIGLALVSPAVAALDELQVRADDGRRHRIRRAPTPFYDPRNERQRGGAAA